MARKSRRSTIEVRQRRLRSSQDETSTGATASTSAQPCACPSGLPQQPTSPFVSSSTSSPMNTGAAASYANQANTLPSSASPRASREAIAAQEFLTRRASYSRSPHGRGTGDGHVDFLLPRQANIPIPSEEDPDPIFADAYEQDLALALQDDWPAEDALEAESEAEDDYRDALDFRFSFENRADASERRPRHSSFGPYHAHHAVARRSDPPQYPRPNRYHLGHAQSVDDMALRPTSDPYHHIVAAASKRSRERFEKADDGDIIRTLQENAAVAVMVYNNESPNSKANDVWPECRSSAKLPARYQFLDQNKKDTPVSNSKHRDSRRDGKGGSTPKQKGAQIARTEWKLPVELVELIAEHLNRDDIKSLRLVSRELNRNVSQVIFQTVVVPFNTEIYGMLGQEPKPDFKGKKRARIEQSSYSWKNANGDEVYNGHGLDVFRGFGRHIRKYGMSFEVTEESLSMPPTKSLTENKTSFWGKYDWPFEEYRRFDAVAGLETAADETPRMKTAFSELTKVKELALSIDSGLGWLNGPDKSIRARVLQRPSKVFGTAKAIPDRKAQAQQELWRYIEACHYASGKDIKHATLYKLDGQPPLTEHNKTRILADVQPEMPYLDPQLIHEATPHDILDIPVPNSFDDPCTLDHFISAPSSLGTGVLFSSIIAPPDAGQLVNPIIPAKLTKAQQEWLLETEWAQRAFMSSYMLSIIDNPITFRPVHSLNISGLSDRYLPMLNRSDFWDALPNLHQVTIMVIPGWRTVQKDEAGFVHTPTVNPTLGTNMFFDLIRDHIAPRSNIRDLTIGWTAGGEHAVGLYARNKLICPAPVVDLQLLTTHPASYAPTALLETNADRLQELLLRLPHVERLKLENCWITPPAFLQLIKLHDSLHLKELVLDSVSLTAILRVNAPNHNANLPGVGFHAVAQLGMAAQGGGAGAQAGGQFMPHQQQILQVYIHTLQLQLQQLQANAGGFQQNHITALQTQLQHIQNANGQQPPAQGQGQNQAPTPLHVPGHTQQHQPANVHANFANVTQIAAHVNHLQNQVAAGQHNAVGNPNAAGQQPVPLPFPVPVNIPAIPDVQSVLKTKPRQGSWIDIIDQISPGLNLSDFESDHSKADSERVTSLQRVEFVSCGYAKLAHAAFDQTAVEFGHGVAAALRHPWFTRRAVALSPAMMSAKWTYLADIIQEVDPSELGALDAGWNLRTGWDDRDEARAVEFDGLLPGGTGRFTGTIRHSDRVTEEASTN
ncbi:hypothetical protein DDE82_000265 [Stemphylium lycopersici]|uniref:F-box domain-containing protein n=1 Tax=Stemphylium lycopersici TaxID=183478 RepID=A0A364MXJ7_STELY|nr:hypothetical protein DDE83_006954 [Stemphylium lycopersici]RAR11927.1 hypothetical protein DDE82_000265 [Stemphylium lycopersici]